MGRHEEDGMGREGKMVKKMKGKRKGGMGDKETQRVGLGRERKRWG